MRRVIGLWATLSALVVAGGAGCASSPSGDSGAAAGTGSSAAGTSASTSTTAGGSAVTAGGSAVTAGGSTMGNVNCAALPLTSNMDDIVSTFEDGTGNVMQVNGRGGGFYMYNDGTGMQTPPPGMLPPATAVMRCDSKYALCMSGKDFTMWGAGMGTDLAPTSGGMGMGTKQTYDATQYKGIAFWAKSNNGMNVSVRVSFKDKDTAPEGGQCDMSASSGPTACNDDFGKSINLTSDWQPVTVLFSDLKQGGWGKPFTSGFAQSAVYSIQYQVMQGIDFDLCIDDVVFVR